MLLTFKLVAGLNTPTVYVYNLAEHLTQQRCLLRTDLNNVVDNERCFIVDA
jgi:hypothetical protein